MSDPKYGIRINRYGRERAGVVRIVKQTEKTFTYIDQKTWRTEDPDFYGRETKAFDQPLAVFDTLAEAEARAAAANAAWADHASCVEAAQQAYRAAGMEQLAAFDAALSGGVCPTPAPADAGVSHAEKASENNDIPYNPPPKAPK